MKTMRNGTLFIALVIATILATGSAFAAEQTIIDEWATIKTPPPPPLASVVTIAPTETALLMLDFNKQTCNQERRPRCLASLPLVTKLLGKARAKNLYIIHSLSPGTTAADILESVSPRKNEPIVTSGPDKFIGTNLEELLTQKSIRTVIVVGTAAHGAVLYTASGAALRGIDVIVPIEGMSAETLYAEQYVVWHLKNAPRVGGKTVLTNIKTIRFEK